MGQGSDLHSIFVDLLGSANVYFQEPPTTQMKYPCILYSRDDTKTEFANDTPYIHTKRYMVTVIDRNPDSVIPDKISNLPMSRFDRAYAKDNLHHDIFVLYY